MIFKTEDLISSIKTRALIPISQQTFQDSDLINLANEEMLISLVPDIQSVRENYFLRPTLVPIVGGVSKYAIPERAIGAGIREVFYIDQNQNRLRLVQRKVSDLELGYDSNSAPQAFYVQDGQILLYPNPSVSSGSLEIWYYCRPSDLIPTASCGLVDTITGGSPNTTFTIDTDLTGSLSAGGSVDIISARTPNRIVVFNATIQSVSSSSVALLTADCVDESGSSLVRLGDYICPAGETNIPLVPSELHPILAQMVTCRVVEALGDATKIQMVNSKLGEMRTQAFKLISNRVENESIPAINRYGMLNQVRGSFGGWWWR